MHLTGWNVLLVALWIFIKKKKLKKASLASCCVPFWEDRLIQQSPPSRDSLPQCTGGWSLQLEELMNHFSWYSYICSPMAVEPRAQCFWHYNFFQLCIRAGGRVSLKRPCAIHTLLFDHQNRQVHPFGYFTWSFLGRPCKRQISNFPFNSHFDSLLEITDSSFPCQW